jgi:hypothetical protein
MALVGSLWNPDVRSQLQRIHKHIARHAASGEASARRLPPRFQRRWAGIIRDAIAAVLAEQPEGLRMRDIACVVAKRLGEPVPLSSIKSCLSREAQSTSGVFERIGRGRYGLR